MRGQISIVSSVVEELIRPMRSSRAIWVDVEPCVVTEDGGVSVSLDPAGTHFAIVLRGQDKVLATAGLSRAALKAKRRYHVPAYFWSDDRGLPRPFLIAYSDDREAAERCAAEIIEYCIARRSGSGFAFIESLAHERGDDACPWRSLFTLFVAVCGRRPGRWVKHIGSYAEYLAGRRRLLETASRATVNSKTVANWREHAKALFEKSGLGAEHAQRFARVLEEGSTQAL